MRDLIGMACDGCKRRNYTTTKNKKKQTDKFAIKKFCPACRAHTVHNGVQGVVPEDCRRNRARASPGAVAPPSP